jgi:hypothetical protein
LNLTQQGKLKNKFKKIKIQFSVPVFEIYSLNSAEWVFLAAGLK